MKVSAISRISSDEERKNMFINFSNNFMDALRTEDPVEKAAKKPAKMGIENLEEFTIFPKETKDGRMIITA